MYFCHFQEYYNDPVQTAKAVTPDGWYKTGDLLRRDENGFFFFVERLKMLIKFRSYHVSFKKKPNPGIRQKKVMWCGVRGYSVRGVPKLHRAGCSFIARFKRDCTL
jgi:hypothetical protein